MPLPACNDTGTALGHDGSDWSHDLATLIFDLRGHGAYGRCGPSSSIRTPTLKFAGFAVRKIWRTMRVRINGSSDLDRWPFDLETGMRVASMVGNLHSEFGHARPSVSRVIHYVRDVLEDRQIKATLTAPFTTDGGIIKQPTLSWGIHSYTHISSLSKFIVSEFVKLMKEQTIRNACALMHPYMVVQKVSPKQLSGQRSFLHQFVLACYQVHS